MSTKTKKNAPKMSESSPLARFWPEKDPHFGSKKNRGFRDVFGVLERYPGRFLEGESPSFALEYENTSVNFIRLLFLPAALFRRYIRRKKVEHALTNDCSQLLYVSAEPSQNHNLQLLAFHS